MKIGKANVVIDGQWGSTGKGKLCGYLALQYDIQVAICNFMSNAGHTWVGDGGEKVITCQLPTSLINVDCKLLINPGAAITISQLNTELEMYQKYKVADRLMIHPNASIIEEIDREAENSDLKKISSTLKGCGGSLSRKVLRKAQIAQNIPELKKYLGDTTRFVNTCLARGETIMVEGAQGFDLSLNHGFQYPYCTSRDVTTMSILNDSGIPFTHLGDVYGCIRTYPIRVGDMFSDKGEKIGTSGPFHTDQTEVTWEELKRSSGSNVDLQERTTVTKKIRRIFTFSKLQYKRFLMVCSPDYIFVNFINHLDANDYGNRSYSNLTQPTVRFLNMIDHCIEDDATITKKPVVVLLGTGPKNSDMININTVCKEGVSKL